MVRLVFQLLQKFTSLLCQHATEQDPYPRLGISGHVSPLHSVISPFLTPALNSPLPPVQVSPAPRPGSSTAGSTARHSRLHSTGLGSQPSWTTAFLGAQQGSPALPLKGSTPFPRALLQSLRNAAPQFILHPNPLHCHSPDSKAASSPFCSARPVTFPPGHPAVLLHQQASPGSQEAGLPCLCFSLRNVCNWSAKLNSYHIPKSLAAKHLRFIFALRRN